MEQRSSKLQQLRKPLVAKLWVEKNPDKLGLNHDDPVAVNKEIHTIGVKFLYQQDFFALSTWNNPLGR